MKNDLNKEKLISVIMASYNSEETIAKSLESILEQPFSKEEIEILVIDGGSTDNTRTIAEKYGARIIDNPFRLPEPAKILGLKESKGKYVLIMDSDQTFCEKDILKKRVSILEKYTDVKSVRACVQSPVDEHMGPISHYINAVGDPFSCFIYKTYKGGSMSRLVIERGTYYSDLDCYIAFFSCDDIRPIGDSATLMDREYILKNFSDKIENGCTTAAIYDWTVANTGKTACIKNDSDYHYSSCSLKTYFKKLKFRIVNNIFDVKGSGYSAAAQTNKTLNKRKYFFPLYAITLVLPCIDGVRMSVVYKHPVFLLHPIFSWYVLIEILIQYLRKILGYEIKNSSYAK